MTTELNKVIGELRAWIFRATSAVEFLETLPGTAPTPTVVPVKVEPLKEDAPPDLPPSKPRMGRSPNMAHTAAVGRLPEPFTRSSVSTALGITKDEASGLLNRMKDRDWIESPARGMWRRCRSFGE